MAEIELIGDLARVFGVSEAEVAAAFAEGEIHHAKLQLANEAADFARSITPVGVAPDQHPGQHRDAISVQDDGDGPKVVFGLDTWNLVEYGSVHNQEYAVRARTEAHFNHDS